LILTDSEEEENSNSNLEFSTFDNNLLSDDGEDQDDWYGVEATIDNNEFDAFPQLWQEKTL
jgi:hypothetical protein